jgi:hypothetical protein
LVQGFKSKDLELQTKDNLDSKQSIFRANDLNSTQYLNSREYLNLFKDQKFNKEDFEILSEIIIRLGLRMKY